MKLKTTAILSTLLFSACSVIDVETRIPSELRAKEFNSIAAKYMERPTYVSLQSYTSGSQALTIKMTSYSMSEYSTDSAIILTYYSPEKIPQYLAAIDKYQKWEALATNRNEAITKEIATIGGERGTVRFTFHSGNNQDHYLSTAFCAAGTCLNDQYYDKKNAKILKELLLEFKSGKIKPLNNPDAIYK